MLYNNYLICSLLLKCVLVYSKKNTTFSLDPRLSQVKILPLSKNTILLGSGSKNSNKSLSRTQSDDDRADDPDDDKKGNDLQNENLEDYESEQKAEDNLPEDFINEKRVDKGKEFNPNEQLNPNEETEDPNHNQENERDDAFLDESNAEKSEDKGTQENYESESDAMGNTNISNHDTNGDNSEKTDNSSKELDDSKQIVDNIAKEEQMKNMNHNAGNMLDSAKEAKEKADELLKQYNEGSFSSQTNHHTLPKDEAGNIVITNTTTTPIPKSEEKKVDPLKSIRDATLSLYERAKHKNLPVPDPGELSTPEQIYSSLNTLEYIIDGYRYTKIDLKDASLKEKESEAQDGTTLMDENSNGDQSTTDLTSKDQEEDLMEPDRFLQVKNDEDFDDSEEPEEDFEQDSENKELGEDEDEPRKQESLTENTGTVSPHQAMENLREVLTQLSTVLEKVVQQNIGVPNIIMRELVKQE